MDEPTGRRCVRCGEIKPTDRFARQKTKSDGLDAKCKDCRCELTRQWREADPERARESSRRYREANPEKRRETVRRYQQANPERIREKAARWRATHPQAPNGRYHANPESIKASARRQHAAKRKAVFDHYGRSCACCGTTERLGIDHVDGDGRAHRAEIGMGSSRLYRWLVANGFPEGFQVLCSRCNTSKGSGERCRVNHQAA